MRIAWLTDLHLNFIRPDEVEAFAQDVRASSPDIILIGGDIGEAHSVVGYLRMLSELLPLPTYFVLGNHDFYHGSIVTVRNHVSMLSNETGAPIWLTDRGVVRLTARTALIGHEGWGDGGFGNAARSPVMLNDFLLIDELRKLHRPALLAELRRLGEEAAAHFRTVLPLALRDQEHVIALTHVPPFCEAAWYNGHVSDQDWLPFFACRAAGDALREVMTAHPHRRLTVLCGHTHGSAECQVLPNLTVLAGGAEYRRPQLQRIIEVE